MRILGIGTTRFTEIQALAEPGQDNACDKYRVVRSETDTTDPEANEFCQVKFQNGPIKEYGINGCHLEDLIAIVVDRLMCFQASDFKCRENALAITKLEEALHWLNHRTSDRKNRGVEGTHKK